MKLILKKVHVYLYVLSVALSYFFFWPLFKYFSIKPGRYRNMNRLRRYWAIISSGLVGFFYRFEYEEAIDWNKTYIVCPNHTSNLDISAMCVLVNSNCSFMGKEELKDGLVTGLFFRSVDIPVNRDSKMSSYRAFKKATQKLKEGTTLIIFPEGKISDDYPPTLHEFKNGPFRLAIDHKIPIIPVSSSNTWMHLWDDGTKYGTRPGICKFHVHKPIETANLTVDDEEKLKDLVYGIISKALVY
ncbi:1-acyl-sn-glycerol-3-phosphate acyltransferase [Mucilaginibacter sp. BJC16-A38]|uniref:lysophospholipid acyltransferase family protein n=1 Tax=Mucilaginibacter phenanthrenivorans TaxID=1234842 RepID=UPI002157AE1F|nr:lysophospholipid acyltransferase family protein [Mucilaginibacter phenanthrenivorans]MCR8559858.1 1-acyl-sn-glycerol-3-phosphate acyltransferase [Mucilaginibacter phenanthrenivorans]